MARTYVKKPERFNAVQYTGSNVAEMLAFCPEIYVDEESGKLFLATSGPVEPTYWVLSDNANIFQVMIHAQFQAYFDLQPGPGGGPPA